MANEKRLIDANAVDYENIACSIEQLKWLNRIIENQPTVDAVEVIRCKDCKHWHEETGWCNEHSHFIGSEGEACHPWESRDWKMFDEDYFCKDGERKDNE